MTPSLLAIVAFIVALVLLFVMPLLINVSFDELPTV